jgi:hypothetical protein
VAGDERELLLRIANQLCSELGRRPSSEWLSVASPTFGERGSHTAAAGLSRGDEELVRTMRQALAEVAGAADTGRLAAERRNSVRAALDGAELVVRGELAMGGRDQVRMLLPSFVFLIALPILQQDDALAISRRARELVEQAFGGAT